MSALGRVKDLNIHEWQVIIESAAGEPVGVAMLAASLYKNIQLAETLAYSNFPKEEIHNGRGDALKHCYLSALLFVRQGEGFATDFMNAHEEVEGNPPQEFEMDQFNNTVGRHIAYQNAALTDEELGQLCVKAVVSGQTKVLQGPAKNMPSVPPQRDDYPRPPTLTKGQAPPAGGRSYPLPPPVRASQTARTQVIPRSRPPAFIPRQQMPRPFVPRATPPPVSSRPFIPPPRPPVFPGSFVAPPPPLPMPPPPVFQLPFVPPPPMPPPVIFSPGPPAWIPPPVIIIPAPPPPPVPFCANFSCMQGGPPIILPNTMH